MSTMSPQEPVEVEQLVAQVAWVRRLALAVARDAHVADDVAQETWVAALRRPLTASGSVAGWFARVVANLVRFRARSEAHRAARERLAARPEREDDPAPALERLEMQEALVRAVHELDDPYRTTVILRWFEGLEPAEIARRTGVPVRTVHTRTTRALQLLRERLDRRAHGDRSVWMSAWIPLLPEPATSWPWILAMDVKIKIAIAATAVGLTSLWLFVPTHHHQPAGSASIERPVAPDLEAPGAEPALASVPEGGETRVQAPAAAPTSESTVPPASPPDLEGIVIDVQGNPVPDLEVQFHSLLAPKGGPTAISDGRGSFRLPPAETRGLILSVSEAWTSVLYPIVNHPHDGKRLVLVVAPRIALEGVVLDTHRDPVPGAIVSCVVPDVRSRFELVLDACESNPCFTSSDAQGHFRLAEVPALEGSRLRTADYSMHHEDDEREAPQTSRSDLEIVLKPIDATSQLRGRVVDAHGAGIQGAWVRLGIVAVRTDADGRFLLDLREEAVGRGRKVRAVKEGHLPVELECAMPSPRDPGAWPDPLILVLDCDALSISGRIVDARGAPVEGVQVEPLDRTTFGKVDAVIDNPPGTAPGTITTYSSVADVEAVLAGKPFSYRSLSGDGGRFEVPGLLPHAYRLFVFDPASLSLRVTDPVQAGTSALEIVLPETGRIARVAGRVVDRRGRPVEGAVVQPSRPLTELPRYVTGILSGDGARTDAEGRFELRDLPGDVDRLVVDVAPSEEQTAFRIADAKDPEAIEIRVPRPCHLQVDLTGSSTQAESLEVQDELGKSLSVLSRQGDTAIGVSVGGSHRMVLHDGRSEAFVVTEDARTVVLFHHGKEVARIALSLEPDQLNVVRP